jgi:hypothetical protein
MAQDLPDLLHIGTGFLFLDPNLLHNPHEAVGLLPANTIHPHNVVIGQGSHDQSFFIALCVKRKAEGVRRHFIQSYTTQKVTDGVLLEVKI